MQDLGDERRLAPRRLAAVPGERDAPTARRDEASVVPAHRLLEAAGALSDGATALHARLRHLEPSERHAVVDLVTEQVTEIVKLWAELVRGVVDAADRGATAGTGPARPGPVTSVGAAAPEADTRSHPARLTEGDAPAAPQPLFRRTPAEFPSDGDRLTRDELTGVLNRQAGFAALGREIDRCRRGGERFVLGYLNVDGLKVVNDARGAEGGDELLRKVTAALRATLRSYDVVTRLGGDEFLFSLPGTDMATAELRFKEFAVILAEETPGSSASAGFAELQHNDTLDELIARAETAMLKGRRTRRRGRG
jgi:diguanylate cyclase (GGDEF)-like protein